MTAASTDPGFFGSTLIPEVAATSAATLLCGVNITIFLVCTQILRRRRAHGRPAPIVLRAAVTLQLCFSVAHAALQILDLCLNLYWQTSNDLEVGSPAYHALVAESDAYTSQFLIFCVNNLLSDFVMIWRLYVVRGRRRVIPSITSVLALASFGFLVSIPFLDGDIDTFHSGILDSRVQSHPCMQMTMVDVIQITGCALTGVVQIIATTLIAHRIISRYPSFMKQKSDCHFEGVVWMLVESGAVMLLLDVLAIVFFMVACGKWEGIVFAILGQAVTTGPLTIITRVASREEEEWSTTARSGDIHTMVFTIPSTNVASDDSEGMIPLDVDLGTVFKAGDDSDGSRMISTSGTSCLNDFKSEI